MQLAGRLLGVVLLAAAFTPLHRLLAPERSGPAGTSTRAVAENAWVLGLTGTLIVVVFSWVVVRMAGTSHAAPRAPSRLLGALAGVPIGRFATGVGILAFGLSAIVAALVHGGAPTSVDEMVQLAHARALVSGRLGLPAEGNGAAWVLQNGLLADAGWVSIYPPFHTLLLALGTTLGVAWLVGPAATAVSAAVTVLIADRLGGGAPARTAGLLLLVSPFWLLLGASHLSHTTAAAGLATALFYWLRAREGSAWWAVAAGAGLGVAVSARPWVGLAAGAAIVAVGWISGSGRESWREGLLPRLAALGVGGAPFAALLFFWNARLFGSPLRLGYSAAFGPSHGLGFHTDPWGNRYGVVESLGYTGADLSQLGIRLLESPIPVVAVIGIALLRRSLPRGAQPLVAWCVAAVVANALYWHHGVHFGPRMLYESAPAWLTLFAIVVVRVFANGETKTEARVARWALGISVAVGLAFTPFVFSAATRAAPAPLPAAASGEVVFVHGSWSSRVASRLAASGMTRDSIETLLRRNDICAVDQYSRARASNGVGALAGLDVQPVPGSPGHLQARLLSPGNGVRVDPGLAPSPTCLREAGSDRLGVLELETVAWRVSGAPDAPVRYARDLGPAANAALLEALSRPGRVLVDTGEERGLLLLEYGEGMELLWGGAAGDPGPPDAEGGG